MLSIRTSLLRGQHPLIQEQNEYLLTVTSQTFATTTTRECFSELQANKIL